MGVLCMNIEGRDWNGSFSAICAVSWLRRGGGPHGGGRACEKFADTGKGTQVFLDGDHMISAAGRKRIISAHSRITLDT